MSEPGKEKRFHVVGGRPWLDPDGPVCRAHGITPALFPGRDEPGGESPDGVVVRLSRDRAAVGEVVEAEVRVPGTAGRRWVEVHPGRPGVRILGPGEWIAEGDEPVTARFTCDTSGPGEVRVRVLE